MADERFKRVQYDPRFAKVSRKQSKVAIDSRFENMFTDKDFNSTYTVDKYGRKVNKSNEKEVVNLKKYYKLEAGEEVEVEEEDKKMKKVSVQQTEKAFQKQSQPHAHQKTKLEKDKKKLKKQLADKREEEKPKKKKNKKNKKPIVEFSSEEEEGEEEEEEDIPKFVDRARGEGLVSSSDEEDGGGDDDDDDSADDFELPESEEDDMVEFEYRTLDRVDIPTGDETNRLACVNMDWDKIQAADLFKLFRSFTPMNGSVLSVTIYPSEFGKERMQQEDLHGPPKAVFAIGKDENKNGDIEDDEEEEDEDDENDINDKEDDVQNNGEESEFDNIQLRKYNIERMRYYFAIAEFDSMETAKAVYKSLDGLEYEQSGNFMDLRFVPDDTVFDDEPKDRVTEISDDYEPTPYETALQHSRGKLNWDEDDPRRIQVTRKKFTKDDLVRQDLLAYIASSSSEDEFEGATEEKKAEKSKEKYKSLLDLIRPTEEPEQEMEITFTPGLSEKASNLLKEKKKREEEADMTAWETFLQKKKEKKKDRKKHLKQQLKEEKELEKMEKKTSKKKSTHLTEEEKKKQAELELLLIGDSEDKTQHFNYKDIEKAEKLKGKKKNKLKESIQDDFEMELHDERFSALYTNPDFGISPTSPMFHKTKGMQAIIEERQRMVRETNEQLEQMHKQRQANKEDPENLKKKELSNLVESVKRKAEIMEEKKRQVTTDKKKRKI